MKKFLSCFSLLFVLFVTKAQDPFETPKLVVGIVVDQMRNDYLIRYYDDYGPNGFKRMINQGYYYSNLHYNYMPTYTGPGHASIYTGTTPSIHGIVGNYWFNNQTQTGVYCTSDTSVRTVGEDEQGMSPHRLISTTITDELKLMYNMRSKVIGVSIKDRGAILPVGHFGDAAYWYTKRGNFISSTHYMEGLPAWVKAFNEKRYAKDYIRDGWTLLKPAKDYDESLPDDNPYESRLGGADPVFPHDLTTWLKMDGLGAIRTTPFGNDLVTRFVKQAVKKERLGKDDITDFLAVSYSSPDYVGHAMGPRAMEIQDVYLRLDQSIAELLSYLDEEVGEGNYLVFLTADHGAAEVPAYLADNKYEVEAIDLNKLSNQLKQYSIVTFGTNLVKNFSNLNVSLNHELIEEKQLDLELIINSFCKLLNRSEWVKRCYTREQILGGNTVDHYQSMIQRGYDPKQNGDIVVLLQPGYIDYSKTGTTHGSPYSYDTHVPLLWYGWNIPKGRNADKKSITQIAPTISQLIHCGIPNGCHADVLTEIIK
jgi:predicted AlkP superfamily pyrophosphatase or phosphodiesterase